MKQEEATPLIPTILASVLENCSSEDAEEIWAFLDGDPDAIEKMILVLLDGHPDKIK